MFFIRMDRQLLLRGVVYLVICWIMMKMGCLLKEGTLACKMFRLVTRTIFMGSDINMIAKDVK